MDNGSIKENIARKRIELGITQEEMARRLGIVRNSYRNIERGSAAIVSEHLAQIASALGTTSEELVLGYRPINGAGELAEIRTKYETSNKTIVNEYESRIAALEEKVAILESSNRTLRELAASRAQIIDFMMAEKKKSGL